MLHAAISTEPHSGYPRAATRDDAPAHVRAMFQRVLAAWAVDALSLRRRGLDRPSGRIGRSAPGALRLNRERFSVPRLRRAG